MIDVRKLKSLLDLVRESGVGELEITDGEERIRIVNAQGTVGVAPVAQPCAAPIQPVVLPTTNVAPAEQACTQEETCTEAAGTPLTSPMVGTFYRASNPGAQPFVKEGDVVKKGQVVCIIEAMKLLNEVEATCDGVIKEICVDNGAPVEYGQNLFIIG